MYTDYEANYLQVVAELPSGAKKTLNLVSWK